MIGHGAVPVNLFPKAPFGGRGFPGERVAVPFPASIVPLTESASDGALVTITHRTRFARTPPRGGWRV
jgi:hypothetical protein